MNVILLRHGEALKNVEGRHGTVNEALCSLTEGGRNQVQKAADSIALQAISIDEVLHTTRVQCRESAEILASHFGKDCRGWDGIAAFNLGILEGLSDEEVRTRYPDLGMQMDLYRGGDLELSEVKIPGASDPIEFYLQSKESLMLKIQEGKSFALVASRSVLIVCASILLGRTPLPGGGYREIPWPNAYFAAFEVTKEGPIFLAEKSSLTIPMRKLNG